MKSIAFVFLQAGWLSVLLLPIFSMPAVAGEAARLSHDQTPRLVVGIVVDQMRPDYIYKYWDHYGDGGFKRLVNDGFLFRNANYRHGHTATGPGHAAVYSGTTPRVHGLIGNSWFVPELGRTINVVEVPGREHVTVGGGAEAGRDRSPGNMLVTTVGDELYLFSGQRSRVVSVSLKDRSAILSGGHTGSAYWFDSTTGRFVTSTFYRDELPEWVRRFNDRRLADAFMHRTWDAVRPIETYVESRADRNPYERPLPGFFRATFPMDLTVAAQQPTLDYGVLSITPFGDELLLELARAALEGEHLGQREVTDMLMIGLSASDIIGHYFGPASKQIQDYYIRLDAYLAEFLAFLDERFEREEYLLVMTADHGAHYVPQYLSDQRIPTGHENFHTRLNDVLQNQLREQLERRFGSDVLLAVSGQNIYLDHDRLRQRQLDAAEVRRETVRILQSMSFVSDALSADVLQQTEFTEGIRGRMMQTYFRARSGDVLFWLQPHTRGDIGTGFTGHGTPWTNDTHVPILFYGFDVPPGQSVAPVAPSDIASTLAVFMNSPFPSGNTGQPMNDLIFSAEGRR